MCAARPLTSCAVPALRERSRAREVQSRVVSFTLRAAGLPLSTSPGLNRGGASLPGDNSPIPCLGIIPPFLRAIITHSHSRVSLLDLQLSGIGFVYST